MLAIISVFIFMICLSFIASLLDGVLVSSTVADVEALKKQVPKIGNLFERFQEHPDKTLSAILGVDTTVSSICSTVLGALVLKEWGSGMVMPFAIVSTIFSFIFSDILPKTLGVYYRRRLLSFVVWPIQFILWIMYPISFLCSLVLRFFLPKKIVHEELSDESLILTAQRGVRDGVLTSIEGQMLEHTLTLDDVLIGTIAQKNIFALDQGLTVAAVLKQYPEIPHGRIPIYEGRKSNLIGVVRRRDLLKSMAEDRHQETLGSLSKKLIRVPSRATIANVLEVLLQHFQQIVLVEKDNHFPLGVVTIEDIFEYILGREIFEYDDISNGRRSDGRKMRRLKRRPAEQK